MMQTPKRKGNPAIPVSTAALLAMAAGTIALALICGYQPAWQLALILLMPVLIRVVTVKIWEDGSEDKAQEQPAENTGSKLAAAIDRFLPGCKSTTV